MVSFMYNQGYAAAIIMGAGVEDAGLHISTWIVADKYDVQDLAKYAAFRFTLSISTGGWKLNSFGGWVAKVFQDTPAHSLLREHCVRVASRNVRELYNGSAGHKAFIAATADVPGFATQVMDMYFQRAGAHPPPNPSVAKRELRCPACDHIFIHPESTPGSDFQGVCPNCSVANIDWNRCGYSRPLWQRYPGGSSLGSEDRNDGWLQGRKRCTCNGITV